MEMGGGGGGGGGKGWPINMDLVQAEGSRDHLFNRGRTFKSRLKKGRPSTCPLITGRSPVPASAGVLESDHVGVQPVEFHWCHT